MFNLEQAIAKWRRQMLSSGIQSPIPLDELEAHLRDNIEEQLGKGLATEQSFLAAVQQIGPAVPLRKEFNKTARKAALESNIEKALVVVGFGIYAVLSIKSLFFSTLEVTTTQKLLGLSAVVLTFVFGLLSIMLWRIVPVIAKKPKRIAIAIAFAIICVSIAAIIFNVVMPKFELTTPQVIVLTLWAMLPIVVGGTVSSALVEAAQRRSAA